MADVAPERLAEIERDLRDIGWDADGVDVARDLCAALRTEREAVTRLRELLREARDYIDYSPDCGCALCSLARRIGREIGGEGR